MVRILHCADLHLDSPFQGIRLTSPVMANHLRESVGITFRRIVDAAIRSHVDLVTVGGDIYDSADHGLHSMVLFNEQMNRLKEASIPCCIVAGNHDPLNKRRRGVNLPENCHLFDEKPGVFSFKTKNDHSVHVHGISHPDATVSKNLAEQLIQCHRKKGGLDVALLHCNVGGDKSHENYAPCSLDELRSAPFHAWLLGHVHERRVLSEANPLIVYPGNTQGRHIREQGPKGAVLIDFEGTNFHPKTEFIPASQIIWRSIVTSIDDLQGIDTMLEKADDEIEERFREFPDVTAFAVRWTLTGRGPLHRVIEQEGLDSIREVVEGRRQSRIPAIYVERLNNETGMELDVDEIRQQNSFLTMVVEAADALQENESDRVLIHAKIKDAFDSQRWKKKLADPLREIEEDPDVLARIVRRGMLRALDALH